MKKKMFVLLAAALCVVAGLAEGWIGYRYGYRPRYHYYGRPYYRPYYHRPLYRPWFRGHYYAFDASRTENHANHTIS